MRQFLLLSWGVAVFSLLSKRAMAQSRNASSNDLSVSVSVMGESTSAASARLPVGGRGTLVCRAFVKGSNALPRHRDSIEFAWQKKDSKDRLTNDKRFQVFQGRRKSFLLIRDFQSDDSDIYRCIALMYGSKKGRRKARALDSVQLIAINPPVVKAMTGRYEARPGASVLIEFSVLYNGAAWADIYRNETLLRREHLQIDGQANISYEISSMMNRDKGRYSLRVVSREFSVLRPGKREVEVAIIKPPKKARKLACRVSENRISVTWKHAKSTRFVSHVRKKYSLVVWRIFDGFDVKNATLDPRKKSVDFAVSSQFPCARFNATLISIGIDGKYGDPVSAECLEDPFAKTMPKKFKADLAFRQRKMIYFVLNGNPLPACLDLLLPSVRRKVCELKITKRKDKTPSSAGGPYYQISAENFTGNLLDLFHQCPRTTVNCSHVYRQDTCKETPTIAVTERSTTTEVATSSSTIKTTPTNLPTSRSLPTKMTLTSSAGYTSATALSTSNVPSTNWRTITATSSTGTGTALTTDQKISTAARSTTGRTSTTYSTEGVVADDSRTAMYSLGGGLVFLAILLVTSIIYYRRKRASGEATSLGSTDTEPPTPNDEHTKLRAAAFLLRSEIQDRPHLNLGADSYSVATLEPDGFETTRLLQSVKDWVSSQARWGSLTETGSLSLESLANIQSRLDSVSLSSSSLHLNSDHGNKHLMTTTDTQITEVTDMILEVLREIKCLKSRRLGNCLETVM